MVTRHLHFEHIPILHKLFNRQTIKVSYCTTRNLKSHIGSHNRRILQNRTEDQERKCNCRNSSSCPLQGKCLEKCIIYQADVTDSNNNTKTYIGQTMRSFKKRLAEHKTSFNNQVSGHTKSELAAHIWKLKKEGINHSINWSIKRRGFAYKNGAKHCDLCAWEKLSIALANPETILNSRTEILAKCRLKKRYTLSNYLTIKPPWKKWGTGQTIFLHAYCRTIRIRTACQFHCAL